MAGDGLQMVVHPLGIIDRAVSQGRRHRLDGAEQGVHGLGALGRLAQLGRRAAPAASGTGATTALLEGLLALLLLLLTREQGVETLEQVAAVLLGQVLVLNGRRRLTQPPLQTRLALGRVQRLGLGLAAEQDLDEGAGIGQGLTQGRRPLVAQDVVRVLPRVQQGEAERPPRLQQG
ncbi:hypothetical protein D3C86_682170 [compost metagenome]